MEVFYFSNWLLMSWTAILSFRGHYPCLIQEQVWPVVSSMVAQPWSGSHASLAPEEKIAMGLTEGLIRLSFGLEHPDDLIADLDQAFHALSPAYA